MRGRCARARCKNPLPPARRQNRLFRAPPARLSTTLPARWWMRRRARAATMSECARSLLTAAQPKQHHSAESIDEYCLGSFPARRGCTRLCPRPGDPQAAQSPAVLRPPPLGVGQSRSTASKANRPTATSSTWWPTTASSWPAESSTASAAFASGSIPGRRPKPWTRRFGSGGSAGRSTFREQLGYDDPQGAARLMFSEADGLSGLIVDRYAQWLAVQITARATAARLDLITRLLVERMQPTGIFLRTEKGVAKAEGIDLRDGLHWGQAPEGPGVHHRKRPALRRRSGRRPKDRLLPRPARESTRGRRLFRRPQRSRYVLLQRRLQPERRRPGGRSAGLRFQPERRSAWPEPTPSSTACTMSGSRRPTALRRSSRWPARGNGSAASWPIRPNLPAAAAAWTTRCGRITA